MNYSCIISVLNQPDIKVSRFIYPTCEMKRAAAEAAIYRAAEYGLFSIRDVWRELGIAASGSRNYVYQEIYSARYLREVIKEMPIRSIESKCNTSRARRYYLPSKNGGELIVC